MGLIQEGLENKLYTDRDDKRSFALTLIVKRINTSEEKNLHLTFTQTC